MVILTTLFPDSTHLTTIYLSLAVSLSIPCWKIRFIQCDAFSLPQLMRTSLDIWPRASTYRLGWIPSIFWPRDPKTLESCRHLGDTFMWSSLGIHLHNHMNVDNGVCGKLSQMREVVSEIMCLPEEREMERQLSDQLPVPMEFNCTSYILLLWDCLASFL